MVDDLFSAIVSNAFVRILSQQLLQQISETWSELQRDCSLVEVNILVYNALVELHPILVIEGREASDHFMNKATQTPPVNFDTVAKLLNDLWC